MIPLFPAQRRAEEFATLLEPGDTTHGGPSQDLLDLVEALRDLEAPPARPEFVAELRSALMTEADVALSEVHHKLTLPAHPRSRRDRRLAVVAGTVALIGATTGVAVAAQSAAPGDTLYPVKRAIEGIHTSLTLSEDARGDQALDQANVRLAEIEDLARQVDPAKTARLPDTLNDFSTQAEKAADLLIKEYDDSGKTEPLTQLRTFVDTSMNKLVTLDALLPSAATDSLRKATSVLVDIDNRISVLCPQCEGGLTDLPARLVGSVTNADVSSLLAPKKADGSQEAGPGPTPDVDSSDATDTPPGGDATPPAPVTKPSPAPGSDPGKKTPGKKTPGNKPNPVKKVVKGLGDTLDQGNEALLGEDGLLGPVTGPLDPLLGDVIGKGGLLSD